MIEFRKIPNAKAACGESLMKKSVLFAAASATAIALAGGALANGVFAAGDVSMSSPAGEDPAGYFVAPDGTIQYRDVPQIGGLAPTTTLDLPGMPSVTLPVAEPVTPGLASFDTGAPTGNYFDTFDAGSQADASTDFVVETVDGAYAIGTSAAAAPMVSTAPVYSDAPMVSDNSYGGIGSSLDMVDTYDVVTGSQIAAPLSVEPLPSMDQTVDQMVYAAPTMDAAPMAFEAEPMAYEAPAMTYESAPMMVDAPMAVEAAPMAYESAPMAYEPAPMAFESEQFEPAPMTYEAAPMMVESAPMSYESAPLAPQSYETATLSASIEPAPMVETGHSPRAAELPVRVLAGAEYAARGDGFYGPSKIQRSGEGPAAQTAAISIGKSTFVTLPVEASEVIIGDPSVARATLRTAKQLFLVGLKGGSTTATFLDDDGNQILDLQINSNYDLVGLDTVLARSFPNMPISIDTVLGEVIVTGTATSAREADALRDLVRRYLFAAQTAVGAATGSVDEISFIDRITVAVEDQVLVKVRIAEMRRSAIKQFGVDWNFGSNDAIAGAANAAFETAGSISSAFNANGSILGGIAASIGSSFGAQNIATMVNAFEQHNIMRVLAEPTLASVSGENASFLAGGQFPYPTSVDENGQLGYTYRDFGVALEFTPVVLDGGRISLNVSTEISELTSDGSLVAGDVTIPGIATRRANTVVELPSGGTMSIAGLLLQRDSASHAGLPGIKNVPVVGQLFSSTDYLKRETELVILVTPYLVRPGQEKDFRLPTDGFEPASDFDLFLMGRLNKLYGAGDTTAMAAREALKSPFGFILE